MPFQRYQQIKRVTFICQIQCWSRSLAFFSQKIAINVKKKAIPFLLSPPLSLSYQSLRLQLLQKMNNSTEALSTQQFPHFGTQWCPSGAYFRNNFSPDLCQLKILHSVSMKELDLYSRREAYSFPFCPRVYKYNIDKNEVIDNRITFDIKLLLEYVPQRMSNMEINELAISKIIDILKAVDYLKTRFGFFRLRKGMIGYTSLGVMKVWVSEDYAENCVEEEAASEQEMINDIFVAFEDHWIVNRLKRNRFNTIKELTQYLEENVECKNQFIGQKQALQQIQNYDLPRLSCEKSVRNLRFPEGSISNSKKNITFSYSNKELNKNHQKTFHNNSKRSSIAVLENSFKWEGQSKPISPKKQLKFSGSSQQVYSLKTIQQKKANHFSKVSMFRPSQPQEKSKESSGNLKVRHLSQYFSVHSNSSKQCQVPKISEMARHLHAKPQPLYYSTSFNPYNKFINKIPTNKSLSHHQQCEDSISSDESRGKENRQNIGALDQHLSQFTVAQQKEENGKAMKSSQELRNDLDALFNSDHQFDYGQLQSELDHIL